jgi:hypothetical protein
MTFFLCCMGFVFFNVDHTINHPAVYRMANDAVLCICVISVCHGLLFSLYYHGAVNCIKVVQDIDKINAFIKFFEAIDPELGGG